MLDEKPVAIITGASGGLGSTVLPMFREAGYRVAATGFNWNWPPEDEPGFFTRSLDLTVRANAANLVADTLERWQRIDALIHLAGLWLPGTPIENTTDDNWDQIFDVNLRAAVSMLRAVIPPMKAQGRGSIVIVGSTAALEPVINWTAFSAAMAALAATVKVVSAEVQASGITVNLLAPSTINTEQVRSFHPDPEEWKKWVDPKAMGSLALWLCGEHGRDITGGILPLPARQQHPSYRWPGVSEGL
jgi:3-oxoacyl-[acyl-carrier protein] reductase